MANFSDDLPIYEEIQASEPISILRSDCKLMANDADDDSMIPRPKLAWPNRKVTFGKWQIFISLTYWYAAEQPKLLPLVAHTGQFNFIFVQVMLFLACVY